MELTAQLDLVSNQAEHNFSELNSEQLNWKPSPEKWSIAQCLDHLVVANSTYIPIFDAILEHGYHPTWWQRMSPFSGFFGKIMVKSLGPVPKRKYKSPQIFRPSSSNIDTGIKSRFEKQHRDLKTTFPKLISLGPGRMIISSPASKFITYSLQHALELIAGHNQRHVNQAMAILHHPNFPKIHS